MNKKFTKLFLPAMLIVLTTNYVFSQSTWQSSIVHFGTNGKLTYVSDINQNRVIDFSYAGYKNSNESIPVITNIITTLSPVSGDNTASINNAIQAAASVMPNANGFRGVIKLNAGSYEIRGTINLNVSGVVLRGSGSDTNGTVLVATGDTPHQRTVLLAGGGTNANWKKSGALQTNITTSFLQAGSMSFNVASASGFAVGDAIIIYHPSTQAWITAVDNGGVADAAPWSPGTIDIEMYKKITAINSNTITIESPVTNHLNPSLSQSYIYKVDKSTMKSLIGVENLRIDIQNWTNEFLDENHAWEGLVMNDIEDSWAKNVVALHFGQSGFKSGTAARLTFDSCQALVPVAQLLGSQRDNFQIYKWSSNILITKCYATKARHAFEVSGTSSATGIVFHRCTSVDPTNPSEGHFHWSSGLLYDCFRDYGNQTDVVLGLYNRGSYGTNHGWAAAHSVAWNCDLRRTTLPDGIAICQQPPTAQNYIIGGYGQVNVSGAIPFPQYPLGYVEGFNNTAKLTPESLFEQQLIDRLVCSMCNMPTAINVTGITQTTAIVNWSGNACAYQYQLQYRKQGETTWITKNILAPTLTKTLTGLKDNSTYQYHLNTDCNATGTINSGYTKIQTFTTPALRIGNNTFSAISNSEQFEINIKPNPGSNALSLGFQSENSTAQLIY